MSGYKYLVLWLKMTSSDSHLNIFTANSIWSDCYATAAFGMKRRIIVKLQEEVYTSGNKKGLPLETSNVYIVDFWGTGSQNIVVKEMFLTNNDDYTREVYTGIDLVKDGNLISNPSPTDKGGIYDLQGRKIGQRSEVKGLKPGIYIVNGKKVVIK